MQIKALSMRSPHGCEEKTEFLGVIEIQSSEVQELSGEKGDTTTRKPLGM